MYEKVGAIDPAMTGTTGALKSFTDENGVIIIYKEFYKANARVSDIAYEIKEDDIFWLIDRASKAKLRPQEGQMYSLHDEYRDNGIVAYPGESDVFAGINRIGELFKAGKIKIFSSCTNLIWELERYHWAEPKITIRGDVKATPFHADCHLCDCLRWIGMNRQSKTELIYKITPHRLSAATLMKEMQEARGNR